MRRDRERDREQARLAEAAVTRARASLEEEDFEGAVRHAEDALALDPELAPAQEVRAQRSRPSMSGAACAITSATPSRP
jgi:Tfp pilus assembly protein PilF